MHCDLTICQICNTLSSDTLAITHSSFSFQWNSDTFDVCPLQQYQVQINDNIDNWLHKTTDQQLTRVQKEAPGHHLQHLQGPARPQFGSNRRPVYV